MHTYTILILYLASLVLSSGIGQRLEQGQCLAWGSNATTTVFYGCCEQVTFQTSPTLALTALCPNSISDFDASLFPDGLYTFSRIRLDDCLHLYEGHTLVTLDDVTPQEALELYVLPLMWILLLPLVRS